MDRTVKMTSKSVEGEPEYTYKKIIGHFSWVNSLGKELFLFLLVWDGMANSILLPFCRSLRLIGAYCLCVCGRFRIGDYACTWEPPGKTIVSFLTFV